VGGEPINNIKHLNNPMEEVDMAVINSPYLLQEDINNRCHNRFTMTLEWSNKWVSNSNNRNTLTCKEVAEEEGRTNLLPTKTTKDLLQETFLTSQVDSRKKTRLLSRLEDSHIKSDMKRLLISSEIIDTSKKVRFSVLEVMDGKMVSDQFCLKIRKNREKQPNYSMAHTLANDMLSLA